ncbi:MAG TPA: histidine phosphatase family protein [Steroidobacter sp.]
MTVVRHASALAARPDQEDRFRLLDTRGQQQAREMARRLAAAHGLPRRILSSPALRAVTTATLVCEELGLSSGHILTDERLYPGSPTLTLEVIHELGESASHLMVVGHNPGLSELAARLSGEPISGSLPTCGACTLEFARAVWSEIDWASGMNPRLLVPGLE